MITEMETSVTESKKTEEEQSPKKKTPKKAAPKKTTAKKESSTEKKAAAPKKQASTAAKKAPAKKIAAPIPKGATFENEYVKVTTQFKEGCSVNLEVQVFAKTLEDAHNKALKEVSKEVSIPGFRKGKVPREVIEKNYKHQIKEQSNNHFLQKALEQSLLLSEIRPLNYRNVKPSIQSQTEQGAQVSFEFETYPVVPEIPLDKIKLQKVIIDAVTDENVNDVIDVMRTYRAKWNSIKDRAIKKGDFVDIDIENVETKVKIVDSKRVQVEKGKLSSWIRTLLTGMKTGESKEATSKWDDDMPASEKKDFTATHCKVTVKEIFEGELPEVDDAFAQAMGTQSVADLKTQVLLRLQKNAEAEADLKQRRLLDEQLQTLVDFDLPKTLLDAEIKTKTQAHEYELQQANFSKEDIDKKKKETEEAARADALSALKLFFVLQKIARDCNIIVPEQELRQVMAEKLSQLNLPPEYNSNPQFKNQIIQEMRMNTFVDLLSEKVKSHLLKQVDYH